VEKIFWRTGSRATSGTLNSIVLEQFEKSMRLECYPDGFWPLFVVTNEQDVLMHSFSVNRV